MANILDYARAKAKGAAFIEKIDGRFFLTRKSFDPSTGDENGHSRIFFDPEIVQAERERLATNITDIDAVLADWRALEPDGTAESQSAQ